MAFDVTAIETQQNYWFLMSPLWAWCLPPPTCTNPGCRFFGLVFSCHPYGVTPMMSPLRCHPYDVTPIHLWLLLFGLMKNTVWGPRAGIIVIIIIITNGYDIGNFIIIILVLLLLLLLFFSFFFFCSFFFCCFFCFWLSPLPTSCYQLSSLSIGFVISWVFLRNLLRALSGAYLCLIQET